VATYIYSALSVSTHSITAVYNGDTNYTTSTSGAVSQVVNKDGSAAVVTSDINSSAPGVSVTFTATLSATAPGTGIATGTVQFKIDGTDYGSPVALAGGRASSTPTNSLSTASHTIIAVYSGDTNFNTSTSMGYIQVVQVGGGTRLAGGFLPVNKIAIIAPWLAFLLTLVLGGTILVLRRRKGS
jgi:hypothetical protein